MKFILSPSKRQQTVSVCDFVPTTIPQYSKESERVAKVVKSYSEKVLRKRLAISEALGAEVFQTWGSWGESDASTLSAIELFQGDVYDGLDFSTLSSDERVRAAQNGFVMSGLYGMLRGTDAVQPYRLDLKDDVSVNGKSLSVFWKKTFESNLIPVGEGEVLVDLTSSEYYSILPKVYKDNSIRVDFKEEVNGKLKTVSFFAKRARGIFARWIVQNSISDVTEIKQFNLEGYSLNEDASKNQLWVFSRKSESR